MKNKKEVKEELQHLSPFLSDLKKENPFKVPQQYFEQLPDELMNRVRKDRLRSSDKTKVSWLDQFLNELVRIFSPRLVAGFATCVLLLAAGFFFLRQEQNPAEQEFLAGVSNEEIQQYLSDNIDDIDDEMLIEMSLSHHNVDVLGPIDLKEEEMEEFIEDFMDDIDDETLEELL